MTEAELLEKLKQVDADMNKMRIEGSPDKGIMILSMYKEYLMDELKELRKPK